MRLFEFYQQADPKATAIKYHGLKITYQELQEHIKGYAGYLTDLDIQRYERVGIVSINCPEFIYSYLAITQIGAIAVPLNLTLTMEEIRFILQDAQISSMFIHPAILTKLNYVQLIELGLKNIIVYDQVHVGSNYKELEPPVSENDVCTYLYTSGTTGKPKGAMLTHKNLLSNVHSLLKAVDILPQDNFLGVLPMFHSFAWTVCVLTPLFTGATCTIVESFQPKETIRIVRNEGISILAGVPSMFNLLAKVATTEDFISVRIAVSGGAPLPVKLLEVYEKNFNMKLLEGYGLSEASPVVSLNPVDGQRKPGSIGLPLPDVNVKIVDENGKELPKGTIGELAVKGPNVMIGYHNNPEETAKVLKNGWLFTGDLAKMDQEGYIYIVDRKKDLIIVGGMNVYPREIEEVLYRHPKIADAAVVGVPDQLRGEAVKACIVVKEGDGLTKDELRNYLKTKLAPYKLPRLIEFRTELPKNAMGKIVKRLLK